jgi:hypothetical protein
MRRPQEHQATPQGALAAGVLTKTGRLLPPQERDDPKPKLPGLAVMFTRAGVALGRHRSQPSSTLLWHQLTNSAIDGNMALATRA